MGELYITVIRPLEKPLICGQNVLALSIIFTTRCPNPIPTTTTLLPFSIKQAWVLSAPTIPASVKGYSYLYSVVLPVPPPLPPSPPATLPIIAWPHLLYSTDIQDIWKPKQGDLDYDGVVNIADLAIVAQDYGMPYPESPYPLLTTVGYNGYVNIYDVAYVAKNFGN
jgi:hypothetical protein